MRYPHIVICIVYILSRCLEFQLFYSWWHIFSLNCPYNLNINLIFWIISVSIFWVVLTYLSFELTPLSQYNFNRLNHECFNFFSRGNIFVVWVTPVTVANFFWPAFGYLTTAQVYLTVGLPMWHSNVTVNRKCSISVKMYLRFF